MPDLASHGLHVSVPASTSNLGPGFDLLGLALDLELQVTLRRGAPGGPAVRVQADARTEDWPATGDLLAIAFERALAAFGASPGPVQLEVSSAIPIARGLGSSGAAIAAGLLLGAALAPASVPRAELLRLAVELEGHPDNVTPALCGGLCLAFVRPDGAPRVVAIEPHASLTFAVAWPRATLATAAARALLPARVPFADAVENPRRLALLLEGLRSGDPELLALGGEDRLHVPYRLPRVPGGAQALAAARGAGAWLATISGSGTALLAISARDRAEAVAEAMRVELAGPGGGATGRVLGVARGAPAVAVLAQ
jgi:homoserine kinase